MSETHVTVKIPKELTDEMDKLIGKHGFRSRGEIAKEAVRQLISSYERKDALLPRFEKVNSDENGVKILDRELHEAIQVFIKPDGIKCSYHETSECEHITYALSFSEVKVLIRKHRKKGWKLPDV